jgi:hypothetical protein
MTAPTHIPPEKAPIRREVALAYRRTRRSLPAEGASLQRQELGAVDAAIAVYQRLDPRGAARPRGSLAHRAVDDLDRDQGEHKMVLGRS